jgi:hypothetical protein
MGPPRDQRGGRRAGALSRKCLSSRRRGRRRYRFGDAPNQRLEAPRRFWRGELLLLPKMNEPGLTTGVRSRSTAAWQKRPASGFGAHVGQVTEGHGFGPFAACRQPQRETGFRRTINALRVGRVWRKGGCRTVGVGPASAAIHRLSAPLRGSAPAPCPRTSGRAVHAASGASRQGRRWCSSRAR